MIILLEHLKALLFEVYFRSNKNNEGNKEIKLISIQQYELNENENKLKKKNKNEK